MNQHQANRVEAIAKVVGDYSDGHDDPNGLRDLKCQTDSDTVHKAVSSQREGRKDAYLRVVMSGVVGLMNMMDQYDACGLCRG